MKPYLSKEHILLSRQIRQEIVEICNQIYKKEEDAVRKEWQALSLQITQIVPEDTNCFDFFIQAQNSFEIKNYLRLMDLLVYEIDAYIAEQLYALEEKVRRILSDDARELNEKILKDYHRDISMCILRENEESRIICSYTGTENISISIKENINQFRLFSDSNPWREASDFVNEMGRERFEEIYVLGFGGGYLVGELERRFPEARIKVFLPNMDIFKTVINHIPIHNILQNKNLEFFLDPLCINFFFTIREKMIRNEKFGFYLDRQELRACVSDVEMVKTLMREYKKEELKINIGRIIEKETIGKNIERYIMGCVYEKLH